MNTKRSENSLIIALEGRIDTTNASQIETEISAAISENPNLTPVFDADSLTYISSAGLRFFVNPRVKNFLSSMSQRKFLKFLILLALQISSMFRKSSVKSALKAVSF